MELALIIWQPLSLAEQGPNRTMYTMSLDETCILVLYWFEKKDFVQPTVAMHPTTALDVSENVAIGRFATGSGKGGEEHGRWP